MFPFVHFIPEFRINLLEFIFHFTEIGQDAIGNIHGFHESFFNLYVVQDIHFAAPFKERNFIFNFFLLCLQIFQSCFL